MKAILVTIAIAVLFYAISFGCCAFIVWLGSLVLSYEFSWVLSLFVWLIYIIIKGFFTPRKEKDN